MSPFKSLLLLTFISILSYTHATCTKTAISNLISSTSTYLAAFDDKTNTRSENDVDTHVSSTLNNADYVDCLSKIDALITTKENYYIDLLTDECRETNVTSPQYTQNPCCNMKLMEESCCVPATMTETQTQIHEFKADFAQNGCPAKDASSTRAHIRHHYRVQAKRKQICEKNKERRLRKLEQLIVNLRRCPEEILEEKECRINSQCFSNVCSPKSESAPVTYTCKPASHALDKEYALARCMASYLPDDYIRLLQEELGVSVAQAANFPALTAALATKIGTSQCVDEDYYSNFKWDSRIMTAYTTETTCQAEKRCTDGNAACADANEFCGAFCGNNGVCTSTITAATDSEKCADPTQAIGTCRAGAVYHTNVGFNQLVTQDSCTGVNYCTVECGNCDEVACTEQRAFCFGFPFTGSACVLPYTTTETRFSFKACNNGTVDVGFGCKSTDNSGACIGKGGRWINAPQSQDTCEKSSQNEDVEEREQLFLQCDEGNNRHSGKYKDTCTKCGYSNELLFNWVMGSYNNGLWTRQSAWVKREMKSLYRWAPTIDTTKYTTLVNTLEKLIRDQILKTYGACALLPTLSNMEEIACACEGGDNCFDAIASAIGSFHAFPGAAQSFDLMDAIVNVRADSIPANQGAVLVEVKRQPLLIENSNVVWTTDVPRFEIRQEGQVVGIVAGHGIALSNAGEGIDLCMKLDTQFNTTGFDAPKIGYQSGGVFMVDTDVKIVNTGRSGVVCGTVTKSNQVYYPVLVASSKYHEDVYSAAENVQRGVALLIALLVAAFMTML